MNEDEFTGLLGRFAQRPLPSTAGRHVYLWQESVDELVRRAPRGLVTVLDLHALGSQLERTPATDEAAGRLLTEVINAWITREFPRDARQRVLAVTGCDLLMRYTVPLALFVRHANENHMIILVALSDDSHYQPVKPLPGYVRLRPDATLAHLKPQIADEAIIGDRTR